jgi:uncharacterized protein
MTMLVPAIGLGAGVLSGLFGIGGGPIIVPALAFLAGKPILAATGTSRGALLLPVGALGAIEYYRKGNLDVRTSLSSRWGCSWGSGSARTSPTPSGRSS